MNKAMNWVWTFLICYFCLSLTTQAQTEMMQPDTLPYHQIPEYPEQYDVAGILSRMVDGLGYRYYWATHELRDEDLAYRPTPEAQSSAETLEHLYNLSESILNASMNKPNIRNGERVYPPQDQLRARTLENLAQASKNFSSVTSADLQDYKVVFQREEQRSEFAFWHLLNGQLADALYHVGQLVSFRRTTGNPVHPGVNVFMGKTREN